MAKNEIRVKCPQGWPHNEWFNHNAKLMQVIKSTYGIVDDDECCNWCFDEFLNDREIKDVAVFVFGNDLPSTCNQVRALVLRGNGDCPNCGSNDRDEIKDGDTAVPQTTSDPAGWLILGHRCNNCKHEVYEDN